MNVLNYVELKKEFVKKNKEIDRRERVQASKHVETVLLKKMMELCGEKKAN